MESTPPSAQWTRGRPSFPAVRREESKSKPNSLSQWKQLRQTVSEHQATREEKVRISHLCAEDKQKVAKLIRQLMKVGNDNEQMKKTIDEANAQRAQLDADKTELQAQLTQALDTLKTYQHRIHTLQAQRSAEQAQLASTQAALSDHMDLVDRLKRQASEERQELQMRQLNREDNLEDEMNRLRIKMETLQEELMIEKHHRTMLEAQLQEEKEKSLDISSIFDATTNSKVRSIVEGWKRRLDAALEEPEVTSCGTQTDTLDNKSVGIQCFVDNNSVGVQCDVQVENQPRELLRPRRRSVEMMASSIVDSEFYDMSLLDLVNAMEAERMHDDYSRESHGPLSPSELIDEDVHAILNGS
ncbi:hypothetical protein LEN26_019225 [Aphanomyces euteiches]|nr:hypothetical protein LEN26_019225 [Aphanomyces euteiches]